MKKLLLFFSMLWFVSFTIAQNTTLSYQAVVRDEHNRLVQDTDIPMDISINIEGIEKYYEERTVRTNHNGVVSFPIGGTGRTWPVAGHPSDELSTVTGWANAAITVTYHLTNGDVTVNSPVSAVPYALEVPSSAIPAQVQADWTETSTTSVAYIQNKPNLATVATSGDYNDLNNTPDLTVYATNAHLNDTLSHYLKTEDLCTNIESSCTNVALKNANNEFTGNNNFTGTNTVPLAVDKNTMAYTLSEKQVVAYEDLIFVFDSLIRKINVLEAALDSLMRATPPTVTLALSDISSNSIKATATANSNGSTITAYEFCISVNSDMSAPTCYSTTTANYTFTGLDAYTTYYVTAKATNLAGSGTSSVVNARTPAHAPAGILSSDLPSKPTGFQVTVSSLDFKEPTEGTVQIFYKQGSDCSADEEGFTAWPVSGTLTTGAEYTQNLTGLEPLTDYCVMVKLTNADSTTTYGPVNTTSGEDISLIITPETTSLSLCEGATVNDLFSAAPTLGDVEEYSYEWSDGTNTSTDNPVTMTFNTPGVKTIICVATHTTEGYIITDTIAVTVTSAGTAPSFSACENMLVVDISNISTDVISFNWGDGSDIETPTSPWPIDPTWWQPWHAYAAPGGTFDIVATNESGCTATQTVSLGRAMLTPCTGTAHEGGVYTGQGYDNADDGREYADESGIYAVTDYDGNIYPVVQIGSQCWLAENLRTEHSPATGSLILLGKENTYGINPSSLVSFTSKMAAWVSLSLSNTQGVVLNKKNLTGYYSEIVPRLGLLYNWCAAVDTFNTAYPEVSNNKQTTTGWKPVLNLENGNRRGICPRGWHLPSEAEYEAMLVTAGVVKRTGSGSANAGSGAGKLVTGCYWKEPSAPSSGDRPDNYNYAERNSSSFSALPGGNFNANDSYYNAVGTYAYFWTSTQDASDSKIGFRYAINASYYGPLRSSSTKFMGASVRCIRDAE